MSRTKTILFLLFSAILTFRCLGLFDKEIRSPRGFGAEQAQSSDTSANRPARNPLKNAYFGDLHLHSRLFHGCFRIRHENDA